MVRYGEMQNRAPLMGPHQEDIEDTKCGRWDGKETNGDEVGQVIIQKGPP
jgi:hypothetical protein